MARPAQGPASGQLCDALYDRPSPVTPRMLYRHSHWDVSIPGKSNFGLPSQDGPAFVASATNWRDRQDAGPSIRKRTCAPVTFSGRLDHFQHGIPVPCPKIDEIGFAALAQMVEGANMGVGQIGHVNVIANARSIRRRIIIPKDGNFRLFSGGSRKNVWNQMRFRFVVFAPAVRWRQRR